MPKELVPVRVEDWLTLGKMFDRAAACGHQASFDFCKQMERQGVAFKTSTEALARYRKRSDGEKFSAIMNDRAECSDKDRGINIQIHQQSGDVRVREVPLEQIEEHERCQMPAVTSRRK